MRITGFTSLLKDILLVLTVLAAGQSPAQDSAPAAPAPAEVETIDGTLSALYDVISGPKGQPRDWARFRSLFAPEARLIAVRGKPDDQAQLTNLTPDQFVDLVEPATRDEGFFEKEIARKTDRFGHIAQVFSTYESRRSLEEEPFVRGINSIQLFWDGKRWWVVTIYWDSERTGQPIPGDYLPQP